MSGSAGALSSIGSGAMKAVTAAAPYAGDIISAAGSLMTANSQVYQGYQENAVRELNVGAYRQEAGLTREKAVLDALIMRKRNSAFTAKQVGLFAKAKVNPFSGSALEVLSDDASVLELEVLTNSFNLENAAKALEADAYIEDLKGEYAVKNAKAQGRSTLLTQLPEYLPGVFKAVSNAYGAVKGASATSRNNTPSPRYGGGANSMSGRAVSGPLQLTH